MADLTYTIEPLPLVWPGKVTAYRKPAPFKTIESKALALLAREIRMLNGRNVRIAVDVEPRHIRQDGMLYANARPRSSAVIVSFDTSSGRMAYPSDRFSFFWANIDAVARTLEDLRRVDRYGVMQGKQYTGFKQLPASTTTALSTDSAATVIASRAGNAYTATQIAKDRASAVLAIRMARSKTHPDAGGSEADFTLVGEAKRVLEAHHGGAL